MKLEQKLKHVLNSNDENSIHQVFEEIYNKYNKLVYFIIIKYIKNTDDVKDLVQDTFIGFYNNLKNDIRNIKYYLTTSAKNKAINFVRQQNKVIFDDEFIFKTEGKAKEINIEYQEIIKKMEVILISVEIEIILQHVIYDLTFKEIAIKYNMNLNTVISIYNRAIKKFKKGVKE